jgi:exopolyphosphatase/guanosine-5'-triphosphate,3'-diphosphate pyrophosphatase
LTHSFPDRYSLNSETHREIFLPDYFKLHAKLLKSSAEERIKMPGMELVRVEMIVLATIFVNFILQNSGIQSLIQTDFALKEGVVAEILNI